jgi:hypothetical protein
MSTRRLFTNLFWIDAGERMVVTFGEVLLGFVALPAIPGTDIAPIAAATAVKVAGVATLASLLKSVVAAAKADTDTASLVVDTVPLDK